MHPPFRIYKPDQNGPLQNVGARGTDLMLHFCGIPLYRIRTTMFYHVLTFLGHLHMSQIWFVNPIEGGRRTPAGRMHAVFLNVELAHQITFRDMIFKVL